MHTNTTGRQIEAGCPFPVFLAALNNPAPSFAGPPQTLRDHIGRREFGDFGTVLMAERPASADLSDRVARWREVGRDIREDLPLRANADQSADDRRLKFAIAVTSISIGGWIIVSVVVAALDGKL